MTLSEELKTFIIQRATARGFAQVGVARAEPLPRHGLRSWLQAGFHGGMSYMARNPDLRLDPRMLLPGAASVIVLSSNYYFPVEDEKDPARGIVARYARGDDYHEVLSAKLRLLVQEIRQHAPAAQTRVAVDSAPVLEKEWARRSGIGWVGKHSCIISPPYGSWILLSEIITDLELPADQPIDERCGSCRLCLDACPTGALIQPYVVDSRKCISALTQLRPDQPIPVERRAGMGNRLFGCDLCQAVCPWNQGQIPLTPESSFFPRSCFINPWLTDLAAWNEAQFRQRTSRSPIKKVKFAGFMRNVTVALRNGIQR
ncbi:tRNA epoxyqueuosine(34) reductase QueG [bacterium]|nr:tRNA epoxyqueuosine(34) reductase QueG [bacterium]